MIHKIKPEELAMILIFCEKFMNKEAHKELLEKIKPIKKDILHTIWDEDALLIIMEEPF